MIILIVDDKKENLYILESLLKANSYHVITAENGAKALEKLYSEGADMIISDILMPEMDGFQFCLAVHNDDKLKHIPFVFYTATYTDYKDEEFALKCGANRFVRKPIDPNEFLKIIKNTVCDVKNGKVAAKKLPLKNEDETYKLYSERLVKKLEKKMFDLESTLAKQKAEEEKIKRVNRAYKALSQCNRALIRAVTEADLLQEICRVIVETGGYRMAWVGYAEEDKDKTVRPMAQAGYEEGYLDTVNITWADTEKGRKTWSSRSWLSADRTSRNLDRFR
jgi:response regulator RpfG family c-di-GMP phosphodiesterase